MLFFNTGVMTFVRGLIFSFLNFVLCQIFPYFVSDFFYVRKVYRMRKI